MSSQEVVTDATEWTYHQVPAPALGWRFTRDFLPLPWHVVFLCRAEGACPAFEVGSREGLCWYVQGQQEPCPLDAYSHWLYAHWPETPDEAVPVAVAGSLERLRQSLDDERNGIRGRPAQEVFEDLRTRQRAEGKG
jgi:hypothetical protein